ncbi:MAG: hypothetical protein COA37_02405 [Hoeflea sp.]|uniref:hypothetical protein n=1 Tax=Hoeflea sp. TaxID=1940281 RepID=UPI000C0E2DBA|nr:hypothetical protein [Hoeflea sp.]PHR25695.1 MAG: hypothetical protein COA37_02405 [Hoeflea sp.]
MLILIANALFEATRTATLPPKPAPKGFIRSVSARLKGDGRKPEQDTAAAGSRPLQARGDPK